MSVYEAISLMIAFATLVILILMFRTKKTRHLAKVNGLFS